jgi:hypothetical protein
MLMKRPTWCSSRGAGTVGASNGNPFVCREGQYHIRRYFRETFGQEMKAGRLARTPSAKVRGRALVDLMQGLQLRAKAGIAREQARRPKPYAPDSWQVNLTHFSGGCVWTSAKSPMHSPIGGLVMGSRPSGSNVSD